MGERGRFEGVLTIVRFNWPSYLVAGVVVVVASAVSILSPGPPSLVAGARIASVVGLWFLAGSVLASHWIYDRSDLYRFGWLARTLDAGGPVAPVSDGVPVVRAGMPARALFCHSGFDECSDALLRHLPGCEWRVLEHFAEATMTEPSIRRARRRRPPRPGAIPAPFGAWPTEDGWADVVFGILAVHELRRESERVEWFREARRCLAPGGRIVLVEHARDIANFLAFGPGFLHFLSRATWCRSWEAAALARLDEFRVTPFVRVFVLGTQ